MIDEDILALFEPDALNSRHAQIMNSQSYSSQLLREAKRLSEKQHKENVLLIRKLKKNKQLKTAQKGR